MLYLLNLLTFFTASFLLFYIYVRTWRGQMSKFCKVCTVFVSILYFLSLHNIIFTFILITTLNILATYTFVVYGRFTRLIALSLHEPHCADNIIKA